MLGFAAWLLGAVVVLVSLSALEVEPWVLVFTALIWGGAGWLWWQRDVPVAQKEAVLPDAIPMPAPSPEWVSPIWSQWVSGWYWETDSTHRLTHLQPGVGVEADGLDWNLVSEWVATSPDWLDAMRGAEASWQQNLDRLAFAFKQSQPVPDVLEVPMPAVLASESSPSGWLRAQPRRSADGRFLGFHGVLTPKPIASVAQLAPNAGADAVEQDVAVVPTPMTESDQEVLRYALSHDLRAPLRVVDGFTKIVKEDYAKVLDKMGVDHLDRVLAATARMNGMIDAILAQAQLAGAPLKREPIDLTALARDIAAEMAALPDAGTVAQFQIAEGLQVAADPILVRRVLENLISNALKYSGKVAEPHIEVGVMPATNPAVFFVKDNGAGFDMQRADKLFGLFQRMHSAKEFPGTGVGLAGVHNIIRRHGGQVWAEAVPGQGACFYFTLMGTAEAQQRATKL